MRTVLIDARHAARHKFAFPGGYPLFLLMSDGECLCPDCARKEWRLVAGATRHPGTNADWEVVGVEINWEDQDMWCAHCGNKIQSAYGDER